VKLAQLGLIWPRRLPGARCGCDGRPIRFRGKISAEQRTVGLEVDGRARKQRAADASGDSDEGQHDGRFHDRDLALIGPKPNTPSLRRLAIDTLIWRKARARPAVKLRQGEFALQARKTGQ